MTAEVVEAAAVAGCWRRGCIPGTAVATVLVLIATESIDVFEVFTIRDPVCGLQPVFVAAFSTPTTCHAASSCSAGDFLATIPLPTRARAPPAEAAAAAAAVPT